MATKVMVVDDNNDIRNLLATWLKQVGYEIILAEDGATALELYKKEKPDMLFLDMLLPKRNGIDICKQIKNDPDSAGTPIVMMTAVYKGVQFALEAKKSGADVYIEKPFQNEKIIELAHQLAGPPDVEIADEITHVETVSTKEEISLEGDLKGVPLAKVLCNISKKKMTGELRVQKGTAIKSIFFNDGDALYTASNQISDRLGITVLKQGLITKEQYDEAVRMMQKSEGSMKIGQSMIKLGYITDYELAFTLREQYKQIIYSLFPWAEGEYKFVKSSKIKRQSDALDVSTEKLILEGIEKSYTFSRVEQELGNINKVFTVTSTGSEFARSQDAGKVYKHLLTSGVVDGENSLKDIMSEDPEKGEDNAVALYALYLCGHVAIKETRKEADEEDVHTISPEMIKEKYSAIQNQNYYQILNISSNASVKDIKKAYFKLAKLYHPDKFIDRMYDPLKSKIDEIFNKISQAHKVLSSVSKRREYEKSMVTPKEDRETIQQYTRVKNAEMRFIEGKAAFQKGRYDDAIEALKWAIELNPDEYEYKQLMGRIYISKYVPSQIEYKEAGKYFKEAVDLRPNDPESHYWYGQYKKKMGQVDGAYKDFQKAVQLKPDYHEAKREIRLFEMRSNGSKKKGLFRKK